MAELDLAPAKQGALIEVAPAGGSSGELARMGIALLALVGLFVSIYLALFKLGFLGGIQCGTGGCETVQMSEYARFLGIPVALWGVGGYAALFAVAMAGLQPRWLGSPGVSLTLFGLAGVALLFSGYLTWLEAVVIRAWCRWCVVSAVLVAAIFLLSVPGLRAALRAPSRA